MVNQSGNKICPYLAPQADGTPRSCYKEGCALYGGVCSVRAIANVMMSAEAEKDNFGEPLADLAEAINELLTLAETLVAAKKNAYTPGIGWPQF